MLTGLVASSALFAAIGAVAHSTGGHVDHTHAAHSRLPGRWYQEPDNKVEKLFRRFSDDGTQYAEVGGEEWMAAFPTGIPDVNATPKEWIDALNVAVQAGKIPNIPPSTASTQTNPVYPDGMDPNGPEICSATYKCRTDREIWDAPDGVLGISFDDGPYEGTEMLLEYIGANHVPTTHFLIGSYIRMNPTAFEAIRDNGGDLAVHTYTHRYTTSLSNEEVVAELGWTMEIIRNSTGGRIPKFWRPPYGDSDNRVTAIAREVFGLTTIIWNQDTEDWSLTTGGTTPQAINASMTEWLNGPKSPGLVILEHELSTMSVQAFIDAYPVMQSTGWNIQSVVSIYGDSPYQNAPAGLDGEVKAASVVPSGNDSGSNTGDDHGSSSAAPESVSTSASAPPSTGTG
ncbi:carbohydrate esterase family 4 protein [Cylindrobasidium torrendii FP15055 ss-10]|uniref:chitin deacetylase n=1 Tax=Cylindrobasidium torrendii FP15055 ss-10 TaxID=1314674 RepID=A0A0D7BMR1_9AGAR|nr:carbohydrate esterase family 4 protein [Cylindrobasidium torrendii FP15055 ss-10]